MEITKLKKIGKGKYKLFLDNNNELILYDDVIVKYNLLSNKRIDYSLLRKIKEENNIISAYYKALKYLEIKQRSEKELILYLEKNEYSNETIEKIINRLKEEGYVNDLMYAKAYINDKLLLSSDGPLKIKIYLESNNIDENVIDNLISNIDKEVINNKIKKLIDKQLKINKKYSGFVLKKKIMNYLLNLGYEPDDIANHIDKMEFNNDDLLKKEFTKLLNKYKNKYSDYELKMIIKQKLYQRGYYDIDFASLISDEIE